MVGSGLIDLAAADHEPAPPVVEAMKRFREAHPGSGRGFPSRFDYRRYSIAYERVPKGGSVLDVGVGSGQLVNALAFGNEFDRVCGIDVKQHSKFIRFDAFELQTMSVTAMSFEEGEFDAVLCMEVLEHLEPEQLGRSLAELRRVAARHLLMTVPYDEPLPLPSYHKTHFDDEKLTELFPTASFSLLHKPGVPWMLIEEELPSSAAR
jgi:SAM-dependent methyltransferase